MSAGVNGARAGEQAVRWRFCDGTAVTDPELAALLAGFAPLGAWCTGFAYPLADGPSVELPVDAADWALARARKAARAFSTWFSSTFSLVDDATAPAARAYFGDAACLLSEDARGLRVDLPAAAAAALRARAESEAGRPANDPVTAIERVLSAEAMTGVDAIRHPESFGGKAFLLDAALGAEDEGTGLPRGVGLALARALARLVGRRQRGALENDAAAELARMGANGALSPESALDVLGGVAERELGAFSGAHAELSGDEAKPAREAVRRAASVMLLASVEGAYLERLSDAMRDSPPPRRSIDDRLRELQRRK